MRQCSQMRLPGQKAPSYWGRAENKIEQHHRDDTTRPKLEGSVEADGNVNAAPYAQAEHGMNQEMEHVNFAGGGVSERTWTGIGHFLVRQLQSVLCWKGKNKWSGLGPEARCSTCS